MGSVVDFFDYIILGGGTAGLTVANRLTEDADIKVLVIEAGQDRTSDALVQTPGLVLGMYGKPEYDWNFSSTPQPGLNNRIINQPRGKQLGGSSALNFMMVLFPPRDSLDAWGALGNQGWDYDSLSPYLRKFATVHPPPQAAKETLGLAYHDDSLVGNGPVQVSYSEGYSTPNAVWMETFAKLGLKMKTDPRTGKGLGAFQQGGSINPATKTRSHAASAHYTPEIASRPNLTVFTETTAKKIVFDTSKAEPVAVGVLIRSKDGSEKTLSGGEIILAAGALMSPQILELSGIGSRSLLESLNIPIIVDNSNVGENLQDHPITCQSFEVNPGVPSGDVLRDPDVLNALLQQYQDGGKGPLGQSNISVAYVPLVDEEGVYSQNAKKALFASYDEHAQTQDRKMIRKLLEEPDEPSVQYFLFPSQAHTVLHDPPSMADYLLPTSPENYLTVMTMLNHPFSRGSIHITSDDVDKLPTWDPNFNSNPLDLEISARHVQFVETLLRTSPFGDIFKPDGARIPQVRGDSLENAREVVRQSQVSCFHPSCSLSMKPRERGGVVDNRLRVYGTKGLRVVDASVFPLVTAGNIQTMVYAVAERAADIIKEDRKVFNNQGSGIF
ncbi:GMC oxidoreductase domain-containing protein [Trichoderma breve]|uniref:GMC oxidoreductase domain-containing protein n=1 Tax=Trichoderma breve TaxID=2034170 RepID=A0A9W9JT07_9HYPO|nr:GMC oxidoreductase domain-containing protein [Trichoderma breve]KAJ4865067.1 GMC oxidoreductase domain-containing protein [Trichoderma breve]